MNFTKQWANSSLSKNAAVDTLQKYGHFMRWPNKKSLVMDLGCGDGSLTSGVFYPYVKDRIERIVAIDKLERMITYARANYNLKDIEYQLMDAMNDEHVDKMTEKFDHIFSFTIAHWIPDHRSFVSRLRKMLKPNGQMFVTHVVSSPIHESFHRQFREGSWLEYLPRKRALLYYTDDPTGYIRKIVEEVGLKVEICELDTWTYRVQHFTNLMRTIAAFYEELNRLPAEVLEDYFRDHDKFCIDHASYVGEPNVYDMNMDVLTCIASK